MLYADFHVHLRAAFDLEALLHAVARNRSNVAGTADACILFLTESPGDISIRKLIEHIESDELISRNNLRVSEEDDVGNPISLIVSPDRGAPIVCVAGQQLVSTENIEVLALGVAWRPATALKLADLIPRIRVQGGLPVIPWSLGKWWGHRGRLVRREVERAAPGELFLGDSAHRVFEYPFSDIFDQARARGLAILPGSDPFPFPEEVHRVASFGARLDMVCDYGRPFAQLKEVLTSARPSDIQRVGNRLRLSSSIAMQARLAYKKCRL